VTARIFLKLLVGAVCVLIIALAAVDVLVSHVVETSYLETIERELTAKANMLALLLGPAAVSRVKTLAGSAGVRLTLVSPNGNVLADSQADPPHMENHAGRPEIAAALRGERGSSVRTSGTIGTEFLYVAVPCPQGAIRLAVPLADVRDRVDSIRQRMMISTAIAFLPAIVVALFFSRYVSARLGSIIDYAEKLAMGRFDARLKSRGNDELGVLGQKLNETGEKLQRMRDELHHEHQELEKLERVRKDFVINVSHELRTPLASIQGYTETLLNGAVNDPGHNIRFLNIIRQNAERLTNLASDLLTLSSIELKSQNFQFASYYVNTLLEDCVDSLRPLAARKAITLHMEPASPQAEVFCDSKAVHQALGNLLDNAIKYTPERGDIHISAAVLPFVKPANEFIEFAVRDSGPGIPAEDLPRLFERFYRVDKARSRDLGGTGLGLAIVKHLVLAHGGEVSVSSEVGQGSVFKFTLPVNDPGLREPGDLQNQFTVP
jgi:two-component system phosphate regulon sensor histidine kinase PhoR